MALVRIPYMPTEEQVREIVEEKPANLWARDRETAIAFLDEAQGLMELVLERRGGDEKTPEREEDIAIMNKALNLMSAVQYDYLEEA